MDIRAMQSTLQGLQSALMRMMQQEKYTKDTNAAWLERSLKQYGAREASEGRMGKERLKEWLLKEYVKSTAGGVKDLDNPELALDPRIDALGLKDYIPGVTFPQQKVSREEAVAPTRDAIQEIVKLVVPDNIEMQEALVNLMMTKGSDEALTQMADYTKVTEAGKDRTLKKKGQALTETGLGLRREELTYKKTGTEKIDKTITKIERARENRNDLMDKMSATAINSWYSNTTKSEKAIMKHIFSLNGDIKRWKKEAKGYDDPDQLYAEVAKLAKNFGATKEFIMKILLGKELGPREITAKDRLKGYLNEVGLSLPILMEYF